MNLGRSAPALVGALGLLAGAATAQDANLEAGRAVVVGAGLPQGQAACLSCHGLDGAGDGSGAFPRITGQPGWYLYKQLRDYASGTRPNDIMAPIAQMLSEQQMEDVAAYYAAQQAPFAARPEVPAAQLQHGGALSAVGNAEKGITACVNCHGAAGTGMGPSWPWLAGQYATYTAQQLRLWQQGIRNNDPLNVMETIAKQMSEEDVVAVSLYFESVRPPAPGAQATAGAP